MALKELPKEIGNYDVLDEIGSGGFGTVYLCKDKTTRELFAIKEIKDKSKIDPKTEIDIHTRLMNKRGNRVVKIIDHFKRGGSVYIVMEYCKDGSLREYVKKNGPMGVLLATDILIQLCDALKLIHDEDIAHRDLTPNNVLIWEIKRGRDDDVKRIRVKVTDFGLSKETPNNKLGLFKTTLGTDPFMAPEVFAGKYTKAADVFSLGSMFYFLLTGSYFDKRSKLSNALDGDNLRSFMHAMLCDENSRIRLDEIRQDKFMEWFYDERYEIDPELREFCSHSQNGHLRSRSQSRESERKPLKQINRQDVQKRSNRDSAFGSDQSNSGSGRCRHPQTDQNGRCLTCPFRTNKLHLSEPPKRNIFPGDSNNTIRNIQSNPTRPQHASTSKDKRLETDLPATSSQNNEATIYDSKQAPWPLPTVPNTYTAVNGLGRCIFYKYSHVKGNIPLVAVLEMTSSKDNQTICKIFELRQNDREQELRILQPEGKDVRKPERNEERITDARELFRLKSLAEFRGCKMAKEGYEKLWGFLKMAASRVVQAYCEEIIGHHKYRVELCLNGWANLYIGPRSAKDINDLKLSGRQKTHNGQVEQVKTGATLNENEKLLVIELAKALRTHVKESVWKKQFDRRNIRCTIYTHGFG
uniref:Protein kinase domain-containing protein n=1 Tax=Meloidogyne enterolobii TaxID=390850 RepID=A0A6V7V2S7_MELEN|nr:unnamed protein product [Meloidogyne enterolobii]